MPEMKAVAINPALMDFINNKSEVDVDILKYSISEIIDSIKRAWENDSLCTCEARVICTRATKDSVPHHIKSGNGLIHMGNIEELNRTNIELCENFEGCTKSPGGKCYIAEKYKE